MCAWTYASNGGDTFLCHQESGTLINITGSSNGWFRFSPFEGSRHRICWSGGSLDNQDFPTGSAETVSSLKAGGGTVVTEGSVFGSWIIGKEDQFHVVRNRSRSSQCLYLTCTGFVFLAGEDNNKALIVANGKESIGTLDDGRQALLAASEKVKPEVTLFHHDGHKLALQFYIDCPNLHLEHCFVCRGWADGPREPVCEPDSFGYCAGEVPGSAQGGGGDGATDHLWRGVGRGAAHAIICTASSPAVQVLEGRRLDSPSDSLRRANGRPRVRERARERILPRRAAPIAVVARYMQELGDVGIEDEVRAALREFVAQVRESAERGREEHPGRERLGQGQVREIE
jgi:hypothetical protein